DRGDLGAGGVVRSESTLEFLRAVLVVLESAGDLRLAARSPQRRSLERAIEVAFELVASGIDLFDQRLDVLVREAFRSGLGERRNGPQGQGTRQENRVGARGDDAGAAGEDHAWFLFVAGSRAGHVCGPLSCFIHSRSLPESWSSRVIDLTEHLSLAACSRVDCAALNK